MPSRARDTGKFEPQRAAIFLHKPWRPNLFIYFKIIIEGVGGGPRVVVSTTAFHARVRGSAAGLGGLKETDNVSSPSTCESQYCGEPP